jgi:hypothetical protein
VDTTYYNNLWHDPDENAPEDNYIEKTVNEISKRELECNERVKEMKSSWFIWC